MKPEKVMSPIETIMTTRQGTLGQRRQPQYLARLQKPGSEETRSLTFSRPQLPTSYLSKLSISSMPDRRHSIVQQ